MRFFSVVVALAALLSGAAQADTCRNDRVELRGPDGIARFNVEIADDASERAKGLMQRPSMPAGNGMLFIYDTPQKAIAFWMRNTLIPLDIIFFDPAGVVRSISAEAKPLDETSLYGAPGSQYVLEINGGLARRMGIDVGTQMRSPYIAQDVAAWPCKE